MLMSEANGILLSLCTAHFSPSNTICYREDWNFQVVSRMYGEKKYAGEICMAATAVESKNHLENASSVKYSPTTRTHEKLSNLPV